MNKPTIFIGDSITAFQSSPVVGYVEILGGRGFNVVNVAKSGSGVENWLPSWRGPGDGKGWDDPSWRCWEQYLLPAVRDLSEPFDIHVMLGANSALGDSTNDAACRDDVGVGDWLVQMDILLVQLHRLPGASRVIVSTPVYGGHIGERYAARMATYSAATRDGLWGGSIVNRGADLHLGMDATHFPPPPDVHPNMAGHMRIADLLEPVLR